MGNTIFIEVINNFFSDLINYLENRPKPEIDFVLLKLENKMA